MAPTIFDDSSLYTILSIFLLLFPKASRTTKCTKTFYFHFRYFCLFGHFRNLHSFPESYENNEIYENTIFLFSSRSSIFALFRNLYLFAHFRAFRLFGYFRNLLSFPENFENNEIYENYIFLFSSHSSIFALFGIFISLLIFGLFDFLVIFGIQIPPQS